MTFRLAFMGTPEFALPTLEALFKAGHEIAVVYSQPPRPKGRGYQVQKSPIHEWAEAKGIPVLTPKTLRDLEEQKKFQEFHLDFAVVVAYGLILPKAILEAPKHGCVNVHGSILPRWRGAAPMQRAILAGDHETGITTMLMDEGLDTGPMLLKEICPITDKTTIQDLHDQLARMGAKLINPTLEGLAQGTLLPEPQPSEGVTHAQKLQKEEGKLNWHEPADVLDRKIRALNPWPGTFFDYQDQRIKVFKAHVILGVSEKPGVVLDDQLTISCGKNALRLEKLQRPSGQILETKDFLNGFSLPTHTQLVD